MIKRTYDELIQLTTFDERLAYLQTQQKPTEVTFGSERHLNQSFYASAEWLMVRNQVIVRDRGLDLGVIGYPVHGSIYVHHMNPITPDTLIHEIEMALDPKYLITTSFSTHQMIHYGKTRNRKIVERRPGDTKLW